MERSFIDAILTIEERLRIPKVSWAVGGDIADAMRGLDAKPEYLEVFTDKEGAEVMRKASQEFNPINLEFVERRLPRDAVTKASTYRVSVRSHFLEFEINEIAVKVNGSLQYKMRECEWGDELEFTRESPSLVGTDISLIPLTLRLELYRSLGWNDKVEAMNEAIAFQREDGPAWNTLG